mgnify:CR=1 FL=1
MLQPHQRPAACWACGITCSRLPISLAWFHQLEIDDRRPAAGIRRSRLHSGNGDCPDAEAPQRQTVTPAFASRRARRARWQPPPGGAEDRLTADRVHILSNMLSAAIMTAVAARISAVGPLYESIRNPMRSHAIAGCPASNRRASRVKADWDQKPHDPRSTLSSKIVLGATASGRMRATAC